MEKQTHYIDSIFYQIEQTAKYCRCLSVQLFQKLELDVTFDEFIVLDTIDANESICQRELAKLILKDRASTGRLLNSLEEKGCVERFVDTKNNRLVRKMKLSEKGGKILVDTTEKIRDYVGTLPQVFNEQDKESLIKAIINFRQNIEKEVQMKI